MGYKKLKVAGVAFISSLFCVLPILAKNIVNNSSFEVGLNSWGLGYMHLQVPWTREFLDGSTAFHGKYSLKLRKGAISYAPEFYTPIGSKAYPLEAGKNYTVSFYAKADVNGRFDIEIKNKLRYKWKDFDGGMKNFPYQPSEWKRYSFAFTPTCKPVPHYYLYIVFLSQSTGNSWIDAIQIEEGELTDYAERR